MGDVHEAAIVGRRCEHLFRVLVLEVEDACHRARRSLQLGMLEGMRDLLAVQPDLALAAREPGQELLPGSGGHALACLAARLRAQSGHQAPFSFSGIPSASSPCRSDSTASWSKRKYERGGRTPQTLEECASSGHSRGS